jgi:tetratricopeptide (TPR) repeat protein
LEAFQEGPGKMRSDSRASAAAYAHVYGGRFAAAEEILRKFLDTQPDHTDSWSLLGIALARQDKLGEAIECFRRAVELNPRSVENRTNLGISLYKERRFDEGLASLCAALALKPDYAVAHNHLGNVLAEQGQFDEAIASYRQALRIDPRYAEAHNNLGLRLKERYRLDEAANSFREALRLLPDSVEVLVNLGMCLREQGKLDEAVSSFQESIRRRPELAEAHNNLASAFIDLGRLDEAEVHLREALRLKADYAHALCGLGELAIQGFAKFSAEDDARLTAFLARDDVPARDRVALYFLKAGLLDREGAYDQAFANYRQGNELRRRLLHERGEILDAEQHRARIDGLIAEFDRSYFERVEGLGLDTELPVFIVGMPRSGTSLVEQILASHPLVHGAGERKDIREIVGILSATGRVDQALFSMSRDSIRSLGERYLRRLVELAPRAKRITDKLPENYLYLGVIVTLFPRARIIHCRRHPIDVCFSCYTQNFQGLGFAASLTDLGHYYRDYERLTAHWRAVLPRPMLEVDYEELVKNQESASRRLVAFCGLDWDERCLAFHATSRAVQTASRVQVRRPVFSGSIGRWKHYQSHLQPLVDLVGAIAICDT